MLETQLELYKKTIEETNQIIAHAPTGKYFKVLNFEILVTATKISVPGSDDLPELETSELDPVERELLVAIKKVFEGPYSSATDILPDGTPFQKAWVVGDYLFGLTFKKLR